MKKIIFTISLVFLILSLFSQTKYHVINKIKGSKKILTKGSINETGNLEEDESDFYYIETGSGYITLNLYVGNDADIDLYLYDSNENLVDYSNAYGYGVDEYISGYFPQDVYKIEVYNCETNSEGGNDYSYALTGTYPDPDLPDLTISSIEINQAENPTDHTVYTPAWNPCDVTVTIENIGFGNCYEPFYIKLLYIDPITHMERELDEYYFTDNLYYDEAEDIIFNNLNFYNNYSYEYHDVDPSKVRLYAVIDYYNDIEEENENNNNINMPDNHWIYFIELAKENYYGVCAGGSSITDIYQISAVYGESRTDHYHNAIDLKANNGTPCYSISSGEISYLRTRDIYYARMDIIGGSGKRFHYVHTTNHQYEYDPHPYRNSGIYIADVTSGHIHFVDRTGVGGETRNPLRYDGIVRSMESVSPQVFAIRIYHDTNVTPNWNQSPVAGTDADDTITLQPDSHLFEIVAQAGDNLGQYHGGTNQYSLGVYSIGYVLRNSENQILINEPDRIVFNSLPPDSYFHRIYASGSDNSHFYYIVTNSNSSSTGNLDLSGFPNGDYSLEVIAKDIDGNVGSLTFNFHLNGSTYSEDNSILNVMNIQYNYPNPFNPTTTILYNLSNNAENPQIVIYNLKGQKVNMPRNTL